MALHHHAQHCHRQCDLWACRFIAALENAMGTYNRFPSGASVEQVKKDAKSLSKSEGIPLHSALNTAAAKHGIAKPWAKVLEQLALIGDSDQFIVFNLQSAGRVVEFGLSAERPIGVIVGETGSGKSVLASLLCESHLALGVSALHFVSPYGITNDLAGRMLHKATARHGDRACLTKAERNANPLLQVTETCRATPLEIPVVSGDLIVVDECRQAIKIPLNEWAASTLPLGVGVLLVVQSAREIASLPRDRISFLLTAESARRFSLEAHPRPTLAIEVEDLAKRVAPAPATSLTTPSSDHAVLSALSQMNINGFQGANEPGAGWTNASLNCVLVLLPSLIEKIGESEHPSARTVTAELERMSLLMDTYKGMTTVTGSFSCKIGIKVYRDVVLVDKARLAALLPGKLESWGSTNLKIRISVPTRG